MSAKRTKKGVDKKSTVKKSRTSSTKKRSSRRSEPEPLIYTRKHYMLMAGGFLIMMFGLILMMGAAPETYDDWDPDRIYSFRRTVLAPIVILGGLVFEIYVIFKK